MTFEEAAKHAHEVLCDQVKVPYGWVDWKFDLPAEKFHDTLGHHSALMKVLKVEWNDTWQTVKGHALISPKLELMLA